MAISSTASSNLTINGVASGLDTDAIVSQLMAIEKQPVSALESREAEYNKELTSWRSLNTRLLAVDTAVERMKSEDLFLGRKASSSDEASVKVTAAAGKDLGTYSLTVKQLAQRHQTISQGFADTSSPVDVTSFTMKVGTAQFNAVDLPPESRTLGGLRDAINKASVGVRASIIDTGQSQGDSRYKLMLTSDTSGANSQMTLELGGAGPSRPTFTDLQTAQDAIVTLGSGPNAVEITSSKNTLTDVFAGVSIDLLKADTEKPVTISLEADRAPVRAALENLIKQYNSVAGFFNEQFDYDEATKTTGTLFGNRDLLNLQNDMVAAFTDPRRGMKLGSLASIGVRLDQNGMLSISSSAELDKALQDPEALDKLFRDPERGIVTALDSVLNRATRASIGMISNQEQSLQERLTDLGDRKLSMLRVLDSREMLLRKQFSDMEKVLAQLKSQSGQLSAQLSTG